MNGQRQKWRLHWENKILNYFSKVCQLQAGIIKKTAKLFDSKTISVEQQIQWISFLKKRKNETTTFSRQQTPHSTQLSCRVRVCSSVLALNEWLLQDAIKLEKWISSEFQDDRIFSVIHTRAINKCLCKS